MEALDRETQLDVVREALSLSTAIDVEEKNLSILQQLSFPRFPSFEEVFLEREPTPPIRETAMERYAEVVPDPTPPQTEYSFADSIKNNATPFIILTALWIGGGILSMLGIPILSMVCGLAGAIGAVGLLVFLIKQRSRYHEEVKQKNEELANSPEYLSAVSAARNASAERARFAQEETARDQQRLDQEYERAQEHYRNTVLAEYERRREEGMQEYKAVQEDYEAQKTAWETGRTEAVKLLEQDLHDNRASLEKLYDSTKVISVHYRETWILQWLYDEMSSSSSDLQRAIDLLDRDRQRITTEESGMKTVEAIHQFKEQAHIDATEQKMLSAVALKSLRHLEGTTEELLGTAQDIYDVSRVGVAIASVNAVANVVNAKKTSGILKWVNPKK